MYCRMKIPFLLAILFFVSILHCGSRVENQESLEAKTTDHQTPIKAVEIGKPLEVPPLKRAFLLPYPPYTVGRMVQYDLFRVRQEADGSDTVIFHEWKSGGFADTEYPASEIKWLE